MADDFDVEHYVFEMLDQAVMNGYEADCFLSPEEVTVDLMKFEWFLEKEDETPIRAAVEKWQASHKPKGVV